MGGYNVYYGGFHNHSGISFDSHGAPECAYGFAKCVAGFDFFGLSDHDQSLNTENWRVIKKAADSCNVDSGFAAFWGFEWTSNDYGHLTVVNTEDFTAASNQQTYTFQQLCSWLSARNCFAVLNHPYPGNFSNFLPPVCEKIVGMELWNKTEPFSKFYYNDGNIPNDNDKGLFDEALTLGWKIGAAGGSDDHGSPWGTTVDYRLAVLAKSLTRQDIFDAMKARRFYSTLDKNIALSFTIAGQEMGSTILGGSVVNYSPTEIRVSDGDNEIFTEIVLFDKDHNKRRTWNPHQASVDITDTLTVASGDYYYVKVTQQDGGEAISSPIWISDNSLSRTNQAY
jgi:hypothetical protein